MTTRSRTYGALPAPFGKFAHATVLPIAGTKLVFISGVTARESGATEAEAQTRVIYERIQTILEEDPEALRRPFSEYPLYPLDAEGWHTPLALAIIRNKPETVRFLLDHGADANARSPEGKTLYQLAKDNGHEAVAGMLKTQLP